MTAREWLTGVSLGSKLRPSDFGLFNGVEILTVESAIEAMESYAEHRALDELREQAMDCYQFGTVPAQRKGRVVDSKDWHSNTTASNHTSPKDAA